MSVSWLCYDCVPEGTPLGLTDLTTGPPRHCHGRNDTTRKGVMGGFTCSCECNQPKSPDDLKSVSVYPATQHLVMEVLAARHRLGEAFWPFPQNCIKAIEALERHGLVHMMKRYDVVGWIRVRLTDKGIAEWGLDE
jgi:hypothetical protein